jgi:predicted 3-demethylubiquinone-9 3-methyltransferase (glyoxalase superfamily)
MQKITPFLWFNDQAEQAMNFYSSIFKNSKIISVTRYGEAGPGPKGTVMTAAFQLDGQEFMVLNGGPEFTLTLCATTSNKRWSSTQNKRSSSHHLSMNWIEAGF